MQHKYSLRSESMASTPSFCGDRERSRAEVELAQKSAALHGRLVLDPAVARALPREHTFRSLWHVSPCLTLARELLM